MSTAVPRPHRWVAGLGLLLIAVLSLAPLLLEKPPIDFVHFASPARAWAGKGIVIALMLLAILVRAWLDQGRGGLFSPATLAFAVLAGSMTLTHWVMVDDKSFPVPDPRSPTGMRIFRVEYWQRDLYLRVLDHDRGTAPGPSFAPHGYRPLPYGFTRTLELVTGDWIFACMAYRWFFNFWFVWAYYQFVRLYHPPARGWLALLALLVLYPFSIRYYGGQLTDPLSHALFALSLIYVIQDRLPALSAALALGVMAKETAVLIVPAYWLCTWRQGGRALGKTLILGVACLIAFLAVRLPIGWRSDLGSLNGARGLMIGTNLGIGAPLDRPIAPLYQSYLQPLLFIGIFLPPIAWHWRRLDRRLRALFVVLVPLVLASSLCFSWLYESRNYVPLLPLLTSMALRPTPASK